jgi:hypothetical protein
MISRLAISEASYFGSPVERLIEPTNYESYQIYLGTLSTHDQQVKENLLKFIKNVRYGGYSLMTVSAISLPILLAYARLFGNSQAEENAIEFSLSVGKLGLGIWAIGTCTSLIELCVTESNTLYSRQFTPIIPRRRHHSPDLVTRSV